ncbi:MAG TPA: hypothetical protein VGA18_08005, partial [Rhodothermales bacterium]
MADGKWQMANGRWQMANGKWQACPERASTRLDMVSKVIERRGMEDGRWQMEDGTSQGDGPPPEGAA